MGLCVGGVTRVLCGWVLGFCVGGITRVLRGWGYGVLCGWSYKGVAWVGFGGVIWKFFGSFGVLWVVHEVLKGFFGWMILGFVGVWRFVR